MEPLLTPGETNLAALLRTMEPVLHPEVYVFCTVPPGQLGIRSSPANRIRPISYSYVVLCHMIM